MLTPSVFGCSFLTPCMLNFEGIGHYGVIVSKREKYTLTKRGYLFALGPVFDWMVSRREVLQAELNIILFREHSQKGIKHILSCRLYKHELSSVIIFHV